MHITRSSIFTLALILGVTQSTTSHPIRISKWVKTEQYPDPDAGGIWKVFEKEGYDLLPDPPHVKYNGNTAWPTNQNDNPTEQDTPNDHYTTGTSELGKPTVSILIPASPEIPEQIHTPYIQQTEQKQEHHSSEDKKSSINATQRQGQYNEILQYLRTKNALNNEHKHTTPASFSHSSLGHSPSFFASRFSFTTLKSKAMAFPHYDPPGVFTTVIILLMVVWIAILTIGLLELGNYLWRRREGALAREGAQDGDVGLDETLKVPLRIVIAPLESTQPRAVGEHGYEFLESVSSDFESDSGSESDEDDYRIF
ncbi:hypothetical protein PEX1_082460 [Penicillium expansum]|uniref:Uncharacterized protein n=1 Tax=Penicillium expansum TaxID=27334 RepID=A0A0A2JDE0_PENEN|nr:hypothetical protein PEX2_060490 [Penicillium expansum]KGO46707.1 hypothetical protein PEXP_068770 [Penicillium expansum]KGO53374.1 hypothetical protein PEX1_082460 [Penicillium expansum]KGO53442.1 hypothetical protein PEX2_060490 [Penicillium expansum]